MPTFRFLFFCLLASASPLFAQQEFSSEPSDSSDYPVFSRALNRWANLWGASKSCHFLLKWDISALQPTETYLLFPYAREIYPVRPPTNYFVEDAPRMAAISMEGKIGRMFSMGAHFGAMVYGHRNNFPDFLPTRWSLFWEQRVEGRWYFEMARRIREGRQANNLMGNYLSLEFGRRWTNRFGQIASHYNPTFQERTMLLRLGMQRRFGQIGWFDLGFGLGNRAWLENSGRPGFEFWRNRLAFDTRLQLGFALGDFGLFQRRRSTLAEVFRAKEPIRHLYKFDALNLLVPHPFGAHGRLTTAWEWALDPTIFSFEFEVEIPWTITRNDLGGGRYENDATVGGGFSGETRAYLHLFRPPGTDDGRHNLSGLFLAYKAGAVWDSDGVRKYRFTPLLGLQSRLYERAFISYKIGQGISKLQKCTRPFQGGPPFCEKETKRHLFSELKIGWFF